MGPPLFLAMVFVLCARSAHGQEKKCVEPASLYIHYREQQGGDFREEFPVGTKLTYRCGPGYITRQIKTWNAICRQFDDGTVDWEIEQYDCRPVSCGHPGEIRNGRLMDAVFVFPKEVRYQCNKGYRLEGEGTLYCQSDAQWNGPKPECHIVECGTLEGIANGTVRLSGTVYGSKAEFSCNQGFGLKGNSSRTCEADGQWSGESPHCEEVWCSEQMIQEFVQRNGNGSVLVGNEPISGRQRSNTRVNYICPPNTELFGSTINICQENGAWLFDPPACKAKCTAPPGPGSQVLRELASRWRKQWSVVEPGTQVSELDSSLFARCEHGYHFAQRYHSRWRQLEVKLSCKDGRWDPPEPWCIEKPCTTPDSLPEGVEGEGDREVPHGQQVKFRCKKGYTMQDADYQHPLCHLGEIIGKFPACKPDDCRIEDLPPVHNGHPQAHQRVSHGSLATYECNPPLGLEQPGPVRCHLGEWRGTPPLCVPKKCVVPDASEAFVQQGNSLITRTNMKPRAEVRDGDRNLFVSCKQGYHLLAASEQLICRNGAWEPPRPWCAEDGCRFEDLPRVENGRPSRGQSLAPRSLAAYDCDSQFEIQRAGRLRCIQGQWLGEPPSCVHKDESHNKRRNCAFEKRQARFKAHRNGISVKPEGPFEHGTKLVFHCEPVGEVVFGGPRTAECIDGQWNPPEPPYCYGVGESGIVVRFLNNVSTAPGGTVYVQPNSEVTVRCWSKFPVKLYLEQEGTTNAFQTARRGRNVLEMKFWINLNTSASIICRHVNASTTRKITVRGQPPYWCPPLSNNSDGPQPNRKNDLTYQFKCKEGYEIEGKHHLHCLKHGEWDAPIPKCKPKLGASSNHTPSPQAEQTVAQPLNNARPSDAAILAPASRASHYSNCTAPAHGYFLKIAVDATAPSTRTWIKVEQGEKFLSNGVIYLQCAHQSGHLPVQCDDGRWIPEPTCEKTSHNSNCTVPGDGYFWKIVLDARAPGGQRSVEVNQGEKFVPDDVIYLQCAQQNRPLPVRCDDGRWNPEPKCEKNPQPTPFDTSHRGYQGAAAEHRGYQGAAAEPPKTTTTAAAAASAAHIDNGNKAPKTEGEHRSGAPEDHVSYYGSPTNGTTVAHNGMSKNLNGGSNSDSAMEPNSVPGQRAETPLQDSNQTSYSEPVNTQTCATDAPPGGCRERAKGNSPSLKGGGALDAAGTNNTERDAESTRDASGSRATGLVHLTSGPGEDRNLTVPPPQVRGKPSNHSREMNKPQLPEVQHPSTTVTVQPTISRSAETTVDLPSGGNNCSVEAFFKNAPHGLVIPAAGTHVRQNSTFRVSCDDGLTLVGSGSTATCLQDGSWHVPSHVTCIEGCGDLDTGPGGPTVEGRKAAYALGDSITLSCKNGTELQPRIERIACLGDRWSENEVPICVPAEMDETNGVNNKGGKGA